jgi:hypothetical protein
MKRKMMVTIRVPDFLIAFLPVMNVLRVPLKMSFPRKWESRTNRNYWTPTPVPYRVFAGVTNWELLEVPLSLKVKKLKG